MSVGQPAYPCVEAGGVIFTYMGPDEPPALAFHKFIAKPQNHFARTKVRRGENYLQGIVRADEPLLDDAKFVMPNLVASQGVTSGAESWVRLHVPVDDSSHVEFTLRYFGESPIPGELVDAAHEILLEAIEKICAQRRVASESAAKDR